jgi:hypothetical protein
MLKISHGFEVAAESLAYLLRIRTLETLVYLTTNVSYVLLSNPQRPNFVAHPNKFQQLEKGGGLGTKASGKRLG